MLLTTVKLDLFIKHPTASRCFIMGVVESIVSGVLHRSNCWLGACSQSLQPVDPGPSHGPASQSTPPAGVSQTPPYPFLPLEGCVILPDEFGVPTCLSPCLAAAVGNAQLPKDIFFCFSFDAGDFAYHYVRG